MNVQGMVKPALIFGGAAAIGSLVAVANSADGAKVQAPSAQQAANAVLTAGLVGGMFGAVAGGYGLLTGGSSFAAAVALTVGGVIAAGVGANMLTEASLGGHPGGLFP